MLPADLELSGHLNPDLEGYWDALNRDQLCQQKCVSCGHKQWPPRPICARCTSFDLAWSELPLTGELFSYTITRIATTKDFGVNGPFVVGIVQVDPQVRLLGHIDEPDHSKLAIGVPLRCTFESISNGRLPQWRLAE